VARLPRGVISGAARHAGPVALQTRARVVIVEVSTPSYVITVVIGTIVTLVVGQLLRRLGYDFLIEVYEDRALAASLNYLLVTLFHLMALGLLGIVSTVNPRGIDGIQLVITRTGFTLLILGGVYGLTVLALTTARSRRRKDTLEDSISRYERRRGP
jgi:hypothetical protein